MINIINYKILPYAFIVIFGLLKLETSVAQQTLILAQNVVLEGNTTEMPFRSIEKTSNGTITTYLFHSILIQENPYDRTTNFIKIPGFGLNAEESMPTVPIRWDSYAMPENAKFKVSVIDSSYVDVPITLASSIHPHVIASTIDRSTSITSIKPYEGLYPKDIISASSMKYGEKSIVDVQICPIQYNYRRKTARVYKKISYKVEFVGKCKLVPQNEEMHNYDAFMDNICLNVTLEDSKRTVNNSFITMTNNDYLILSTPKYKEATFKFAKWKGMLGFNTHIELRDSGQWTPTMIANVINDYIENSDNLSYVLLIGDHEDVPAKATNTPGVVSDFYYTNSLDSISPVGLGRLPVSTPKEAEIVVNKIITYENAPVQDSSFYKKVLNCAYFQDRTYPYDSIPYTQYAQRRFAQTAEEIRNHLLLQGKDVERVYYCHSNSNPKYWNNGIYSWGEEIPIELQKPNFKWNGTASDIVTSINNGTFCVIHNDHGGPDVWRDPWFHKYDIYTYLANGNKTPVVFSINCETGKFNEPKCFAEEFLCKENGGCVAIYAFSGEGYSGYNDALITGMIDAIWPSPSLIPVFPNKDTHATPTPTPVYTLSQIMKQGLKRMNETWYNNYQNIWKLIYERFHCFGDPSMKIYTEKPTIFSNATVDRHDNHIYVRTGGEKATISFYNIENGSVESYIDSTAMFWGDTEHINVCISAHNRIPYIEECPITHIQNTTISASTVYENDCILVGSHVTTTEPEGSVIIKSGKTTLRAKTIILNGETEVKLGAEFNIINQ